MIVDVVSETPRVRFLGLDLGERNARVVARETARRVNATLPSHPEPRIPNPESAVLTIPSGVAVTRALVEALPSEPGMWHLTWAEGRPPITWRHATSGSPDVPQARQLPEGAALDVSTSAARRRAAWHLLRASGKPTDGWQSRHVHRRISRLFSFVFLQLGLSANVATWFTFAVGVLASWFIAQTTHQSMIAGAALFWFASIADGIDGEMARLTLSESAWGEQLDTAVDHLTHLFGLAAALVGWWRQGIGPAGVALGILVAAGIPAVLLWSMTIVRRARGAAEFFVDTKPIEFGVTDAAAATGAWTLALASWVFVLFRREAFCLTFFLVSLATGRRAVVPALIGVSLAIVVSTLVVYREAIEDAIKARFSDR